MNIRLLYDDLRNTQVHLSCMHYICSSCSAYAVLCDSFMFENVSVSSIGSL